MSSEQWNTISFPKLGIEFPVYSTAFEIFGIEIKWYGILITIGVLLAVIYCFKRMEKVGLDGDRAVDAVFWGFIGAVVGARLYYVFMNWSEYSGKKKDYQSGTFDEEMKKVLEWRQGYSKLLGNEV